MSDNLLSLYPNPSPGKILVNIISSVNSKALIKIFDGKGALVKQQQAGLVQGMNQVQVDTGHLANGAYHVSAEWNNGQVKKTVKMLKQ